MNNIMEYKGYTGSVEFSEKDGVFYGKVQGIRSLISYEGTTAAELVSDFHASVDDYLAACEQEGTHAGCKAYTDGRHIAFDELHCVIDRHTGRDRPAGAVDIKLDILVGIL